VSLLVVGPACYWGKKDGPAVITGYVYEDATGEGIPGAQVILSPSDLSVQTEADGSYRFDNLPAGKFTVRARAAGFKDAEERGVRADAGKVTWAKLFLKRVPKPGQDG
jgi:iron complex outermembrane receptor protein